MKTLDFVYRMKLEFESPVWEHDFALRFIPHTDYVQKIQIQKKIVDPFDWLYEDTDAFGNKLYVGRCAGEHLHFMYEVVGTAKVDSMTAGKESCDYCYLYPTKLTAYSRNICEFASEVKQMNVSAYEKASILMQKLYDVFTYQTKVTDITTTSAEAFDKKAGVCQDYAHIFIALCRYCRIPARYVAGLQIGEGATHAWAEIYDQGVWKGFDPTHNRYVDDIYIKLSHGRDYTDCILDRGVFYGNTTQRQEIYSYVEERT